MLDQTRIRQDERPRNAASGERGADLLDRAEAEMDVGAAGHERHHMFSFLFDVQVEAVIASQASASIDPKLGNLGVVGAAADPLGSFAPYVRGLFDEARVE